MKNLPMWRKITTYKSLRHNVEKIKLDSFLNSWSCYPLPEGVDVNEKKLIKGVSSRQMVNRSISAKKMENQEFSGALIFFPDRINKQWNCMSKQGCKRLKSTRENSTGAKTVGATVICGITVLMYLPVSQ